MSHAKLNKRLTIFATSRNGGWVYGYPQVYLKSRSTRGSASDSGGQLRRLVQVDLVSTFVLRPVHGVVSRFHELIASADRLRGEA